MKSKIPEPVSFTLLGKPDFKRRHRVTTIGQFARMYDDPKNAKSSKLLIDTFFAENPNIKQNHFGKLPLRMELNAYFALPKRRFVTSVPRTTYLSLLEKSINTNKPDCDNIAKYVMDAFNNVLYHDDSQITKIEVAKYFTKNYPRIEFTFTVMEFDCISAYELWYNADDIDISYNRTMEE